MSARHRLVDREERKRRRDASRARGRRLRRSTPATTALARVGFDTVPGRSAREWNAVNVARLYDLVPKKVGRKVVKDRKGRPVMVRVRTGFRNVIDEHGAHV